MTVLFGCLGLLSLLMLEIRSNTNLEEASDLSVYTLSCNSISELTDVRRFLAGNLVLTKIL